LGAGTLTSMTSSPCDITLFVPGLLGPQPVYSQLSGTDKPNLQLLESWLSRADHTTTSIRDPLTGLFSLFNLTSATDEELPVAAVTAAYDGLDAGQGWWLRADPVYLQPDRDQAVLVASEALQLQPEECAALLETINAHFAVDGWHLRAPHPQRWYLQLEEADAISTTPLPHVMGRGVNQHLPQGKSRQQWHGRWNELQMLLHQHPVNQQRVEAGKLPVNSVWLWGEGSMPTVASSNWDQVYGDDVLVKALAQLATVKHAPLAAFNPRTASGRCLLVINNCYATVQDKDVFRWLACVEDIQNRYLSSLQANLKQQPGSVVTLLPANGHQYRLTQRRLPRWWHRRRPLETFLSV
jgi:hypothetical protein